MFDLSAYLGCYDLISSMTSLLNECKAHSQGLKVFFKGQIDKFQSQIALFWLKLTT